ncbi:MAG: hypothetical protein IJ894_10120 [Bacteroidales bacterium]|nr:hypothetical protein [Bacteroidales bacterium]
MKKKFHLARVAMMTLLVLLITMAQTSRAVTPDDPEIIEISNASELIDFAAAVNGGNSYSGKTVVLTRDIDFAPTAGVTDNFTAIGTSSNKFLGTFDGGGHTIRGIIINQPAKSYQGLFGCIGEGAVVKDVVLDDAQIIGSSNTGGIVGDNKGTISGCTVTDNVTISATEDNKNHYGGIAGNNSGTITNCKSSAVMSFDAYNCGSVGGIVGYNDVNSNSCTISNCTSYATITYNGSYCAYFGGIVGYNKSGTISNCTSYATVTATVTGSSCSSFGGIVGNNYSSESVVTQCVSYAAVTCTGSNYGSIAGENFTGTLSNNYYYNSTVNGNTSSVGCKGADIETNDGAIYAYIIDGDSETTVNPTVGKATRVVYLRKLKSGVTSTIMLPFNFDASSFSGTFYQLSSVNMSDWTAGAESVPGPLSANTPYLFTPSADIDKVVFSGVSLVSTSGDHSVEIGSNWSFVGVYEKILWTSAPSGEYGFSAINKGDNISAGDFVKIGANVRIKPTRAYLHYNDGTSKSSVVLPERITVVFSDHIATPISELPAQIANTKVWSYDKTIYIESAPETNYRIIDAAGRVLRTATTHANREQISLGNYGGIVIVIINNETFKITY